MIAYLDTSVVVRIVLDEPDPLREWMTLEGGISSVLLRVECYRALERLWHAGELNAEELTSKRLEVTAVLQRLRLVELTDAVLHLAAEPLPTHLNTLDAIHLATAILHRRSPAVADEHFVFATHDRALARAAAAMHFEVIGV